MIAVIELKSTKTKTMEKIVDQAFAYKHNHPNCRYVITSNFEKLRLYIDDSTAYEEFDLFSLDVERFTLLFMLLSQESIFADAGLRLKEQSKLEEQNISNELYKKYAALRSKLFDNLVKNNPHVDKLVILNKTQTLLDRLVFIFFAEDRGILKPNTIAAIIDYYKSDIEHRPLYHFYKIYFQAISEGNERLGITAYNGGLFATDALLDSLVIEDEILGDRPLEISGYDFNTDIDVNILGHIFENSLSDIEESDFDRTKTKRKKDGVFYTPEYITKYIVDHTLGTLCEAKKKELGLLDAEIAIPKTKALNKSEKAQLKALEDYRVYLKSLKILDPACGSGAFLNQSLNFLITEHSMIDEGIRTLLGGHVLGLFDVKKEILENNLYGVDINPEAVEIAKLSLWLRTVEHGRKLNILSGKIKVGNSLIDDKSVVDNAFVWEEEFPEVFAHGGFDVVIGNPPYVRQELLDEKSKAFFKTRYATYHGTADLYIFFIERGFDLLAKNGKFSFIFPNKWLKANYGKPMRAWLKTISLDEIVDFGDLQVFDDATTYPMIMTLTDESAKKAFGYLKMQSLNFGDLQKYVNENSSYVETENLSDDGWQLVSADIQKILERTAQNSVALGAYTNGEIMYGIKTGLTEAFVIGEATKNKLIAEDAKSAEVIKPFLMGKDIQRYDTPDADKYLIFTRREINIDAYPVIKKYLEGYKERLMPKPKDFTGSWSGRKAGSYAWYEVQDTVAYHEAFEKPKIIYLVF